MIKAKPPAKAERGHNSKVKAGPVNADRLKSFVERVEKLEEERKAIGGDIKDVYAEAKGVGYDVKTMRWAVQERSADASDRAERDSLRDVYAHALGMPGATYRDVAEQFNVPKSTLHRLVPKSLRGTRPMVDGDLGEWLPEHDPDTGELTETGDSECLSGRDAPSDEHSESCGGGDFAPSTSPTQGPVVSEPDETRPAVAGCASGTSHTQGNRPVGVATGPQEPDITLPAFLDRRQQVRA